MDMDIILVLNSQQHTIRIANFSSSFIVCDCTLFCNTKRVAESETIQVWRAESLIYFVNRTEQHAKRKAKTKK